MIRLKICGMKFPENITEVTALTPDYLGLIFFEGSPRFFNTDLPSIDPAIKRTGVFVNASLPEIISSIEKHQLQAIQLHGEETPQFCEALRREFGAERPEVLKVFSIQESFSFELLRPYEGKADYFLFDTAGSSRGGTGQQFNWELLLQYDSPTPFFLSGGIGPEDAEAILHLKQQLDSRGLGHLLYGIDVNSKFESEPGRKEVKKLKEFKITLEKMLQKNNN